MLGLLLNDLHTTNHISTTILSQGLCSPAMLKKYMTGQKKPEKLLGDALWQRAGKSMEKFEVFLEQDEYSLAIKRANIQLLIRHGKLSEALLAIEDYEKQEEGKNPLHIQFLCLQYAEIYRREKKPHQKQLQNLRKGIKQTIFVAKISPKIFDTYLLSMLELLLLERYAFLLEEKNSAEALRWYQALITYLTKPGSDGSLRDLADNYRLLPPLYYYQAELLLASNQEKTARNTLNQEKAALNALNQGIDLLRKRQCFEGLFLRMEEMRIQLLQKLNKISTEEAKEIFTSNTESFSLSSEIACFEVLKEELTEYGAKNLENIYPDYPERATFSVNHIFQERRLSRGIPIEDMAMLIDCDVRTLQNIESGKRMPQTATKNKFFQYFGLPTWKYCASISTRTYSFFYESTDITVCNYQGNYNTAEEIYKRIVKALKKEDPINQQFIKYWSVNFQYSNKKISKDKYLSGLLEILQETLPRQDTISGQYTLIRYEREIFEDLSWNINNKNLHTIEDILRTQYKKFNENEPLAYLFPEYYTALAYCLAKLTKLQHNFEESEKILEETLHQIHFLQGDFRLDCLHMQHFWLEIEKQQAQGLFPAQNKDKSFRWIRYAYVISKFYRLDSVITKHIENHLTELYGDTNEILADLL